MSDGLIVPAAPDGMGCFDLGGNRVALVRNHELKPGAERKGAFAGGTVKGARVYAKGASGEPLPGGTTTIVYDMASGEVKSEHLSLAGTAINCAGAVTPWGRWLSCEEAFIASAKPHGTVFRVPASARGRGGPV